MSAQPVRRLLVDALLAQGISFIAGNPGSTEVPLLDMLAGEARLPYILTLHESVAVALADGYAQLARRPSVVSVHATPGISNILGGLFLAHSHRSPVVVLAGQQDSRLLGRRPFLASDLVATVRQHTKLAVQVGRAEDVVPTVTRAIRVALEPPAGPVVVAIPKDFLDAMVELSAVVGLTGRAAVAGGRRGPAAGAIQAMAAAIGAARAPVIELAGVKVVVLSADQATPLPGPGLITSTATLAAKAPALRAFVAATLTAMNEIAANPQAGLDTAIKTVPDLGQDPAKQSAILKATVATWQNPRTGAPYGAIDRASWLASLDFMTSLGLVPNKVSLDQLVTTQLLTTP